MTQVQALQQQFIKALTQAGLPELAPGDRLAAVVLQKDGDQYLFQNRLMLFKGESDVPLNPGDTLQLRYEGLRDGQMVLRELTQSGGGSAQRDAAPATLRIDAGSIMKGAQTEVLSAGQRFFGAVVSKEGDSYLLRKGDGFFLAQSDVLMAPGEKGIFIVKGRNQGALEIVRSDEGQVLEAPEEAGTDGVQVTISELARRMAYSARQQNIPLRETSSGAVGESASADQAAPEGQTQADQAASEGVGETGRAAAGSGSAGATEGGGVMGGVGSVGVAESGGVTSGAGGAAEAGGASDLAAAGAVRTPSSEGPIQTSGAQGTPEGQLQAGQAALEGAGAAGQTAGQGPAVSGSVGVTEGGGVTSGAGGATDAGGLTNGAGSSAMTGAGEAGGVGLMNEAAAGAGRALSAGWLPGASAEGLGQAAQARTEGAGGVVTPAEWQATQSADSGLSGAAVAGAPAEGLGQAAQAGVAAPLFALMDGMEKLSQAQMIADAMSKTGDDSAKTPVLATVVRELTGQTGPFFHHVGEKLNLTVMGKTGDGYIVKSGNDLLLLNMQDQLTRGEQVCFVVLSDSRKQSVLKRISQGPEKPMDDAEKAQQVLRRFGIAGSRDMQTVQAQARKIPGEQTTALRYLLDPNLLAAMLMPEQTRPVYQRVEVTQYQGGAGREDSYEIALCLDLEHLGHLEISLRWTQGMMTTRIWADSVETETELTQRKEEIEALGMYLEIVPFSLGPLVERDYSVTLDMKA
jgi:hypothetical protein